MNKIYSGKNYKEWLVTLKRCSIIGAVFFFVSLFVLNENYIDMTFKHKTYLLEKNPGIVFAGDSRAQRQLVPYKAIEMLNLNDGTVVNIAVEGADIIALAYLIEKTKDLFSDVNLVISVSSAQLNDEAISSGAYTNSMISKLNLWEQISLFAPDNLDVLQLYYGTLFKDWRKKILTPNRKYSEDEKQTLGFLGIKDVWKKESFDVDEHISKFVWHKKWNINGKRRAEFVKALDFINSKVKSVFVYSGPVAPTYLGLMKDTDIIKQEDEFNHVMQTICMNKGVPFKEYLYDKDMKDEYFYDPFHLNEVGANIFTEKIVEDALKLLPGQSRL